MLHSYLNASNPNHSRFIAFLVLIYPATAAIVAHAGGIVLYLLVLAGLCWGWSAITAIDKGEKQIFLGFMLLLLVVLLSFINTEHIEVGIPRIERYMQFALGFFALLYMRKMAGDLGQVFLWSLVIGALALCLNSIYETQILDKPRAWGASYAIFYGDFAALLTVILCVAAYYTPSGIPRWAIWLGILAGFLGTLFSGTKGALLLFLLCAPFALVKLAQQFSTKKLAVYGLIATIGLVAGLYVAGDKIAPVRMMQQQLSSLQENGIENAAGTFSARYSLWRDAVAIWKDNPVLGTGVGDFHYDAKLLMDAGQSIPRSKIYWQAHNIFFDTLAIMGLLGLIVLVATLFVIGGRYFLKTMKAGQNDDVRMYASMGFFLIFSFFVFGLTESWYIRNPFVRAYVVFLVFILILMHQSRENSDTHEN